MYQKLTYSIFFLLAGMVALAQHPDQYPPPVPETIDINLFNIILYIVLPLTLVVAFFWYRNYQKKNRHKVQSDKNNDKK